MSIEYNVIRSRRRTLELRVYPDRRVEVRAPLRASQRDIEAFVRSRRAWLSVRLERIAARPVVMPETRYAEGSSHWYLGERICLGAEHTVSEPLLREGTLLLNPSLLEDWRATEAALEDWYRKRAAVEFAARVERLYPFFAARNHPQPVVRIKKMTSRWGSMSVTADMSLSLDLIKVPPECIDYVILHELCHLEHMNHGPAFKALMSQLMPDWPQRRQRLRRQPLS